jgi:2,4-dienoyl-CoA reductase-like NADH-dependent reductase (Old Yellow Enzyme family)/NADPH-dependent 2,4-dienoyl-CoA reductase/sulfur reductase-like enzyme
MPLSHLFSPIKLGKVEIPNRTAMAPMGVGLSSPDETWPYREIRYFEERAIGGTGLIITPFTRVHGSLASIQLVGIYDDRFIPSHKRLVGRIHRYDTKIFLQIALSGGQLSHEAPTSMYSNLYPVKPRELTADEIDELVGSFLKAAARAVESGYDGVEVHGAHSYLIGQMMSPALNKRTDRYGGTFEKRMKFPTDIIAGIQKQFPDLPVGFKFSADEALPGGVDIDMAKDIARHIAGLGISYLHVSSTGLTNEFMYGYCAVSPMYVPRNTLMPLASAIKKAVPGTPVIAGGSITVPEEAEEFIAQEKCDLAALGRTILADPHWAGHARKGERVVPCIRCNVCYLQLWTGKVLWCSVNPYLLHETEQKLPIPAEKKKVMVVGSGPAGIRCALTAAKRGHDVLLCEKEPHVGGMVYPGSRPECKADVARLYDWYVAELRDSTVTLRLNCAVTPEMVEKEAPDALIIAVGAEPLLPDVPGIHLPHVALAVDVLRDVSRFNGKKAVVVGGGEVGCETACHMADHGWDVAIIEILPVLMHEMHSIFSRYPMLELLKNRNVKIMTETRLNAVTPEGIEVILPNQKQWGVDADLVVIAVGIKQTLEAAAGGSSMNLVSVSGLVGSLAMKADEVHIIGDCASLGRIREATEAGERVGSRI